MEKSGYFPPTLKMYIFLGILTGSLFVTVSSNLECFICEGSYENGCSNQTLETCDEAMTICSEIITVIKAGNQSVSMIQKSCGSDSATTNTYKKNYEGLTILLTKRGCNSSKCNNATSPLPQDTAKPDSPAADAVECYSCINTNQTLCLPEKVKCPKDKNNCYDGVASVVQGGFEQTIFVKQCSNGSSHELFQHKWLNISLNSTFCSGNLCNDQPETTTIPSTKTPKVNSTTIIRATTNGVSSVARYSSALLYLPILLLSMLS
ncbi:testis-expressed protein 101 [Discoglossus pictus]